MSSFISPRQKQSFPLGRTLAVLLTGTSHMVTAESIVDSYQGGAASIVTLPQFAVSRFEGRQSINRIQWDGGAALVVVPLGERAVFSWKVEDSSLPQQGGLLAFNGEDLAGDLPELVEGTEPAAMFCASAAAVARQLRRVAEEGRGQMIELVKYLAPYTLSSVHSASRRVYREIHDMNARPDFGVVDEFEAEAIADRLLYGEDGSSSSVATRLVRRVAATDAVVRKSIATYISTAIFSAAESYVRAFIGDPHAGRVIRRLARSIGSTDPFTVLEAYRDAYPETDIGIGRVTAAMSAGATVASLQLPLSLTNEEDA